MSSRGPVANPNNPQQMGPAFAWWYFFFKWVFPLSIAILAGTWVALALTGAISVPFVLSAFGMSSGVIFDSFSAIAMITFTVGTVASMAGLLASLLVRGTLLFNVLETNLFQTDTHNSELQRQVAYIQNELRLYRDQQIADHQELVQQHRQVLFRVVRPEPNQGQQQNDPEQVVPQQQQRQVDQPQQPPAIPAVPPGNLRPNA